MKVIDQKQSSVAKLNIYSNGREDLVFNCPACKQEHALPIKGIGVLAWSWNGNLEKPTLSPSVLTRGTCFTEKGERDYKEWYDNGSNPDAAFNFETEEVVCHLFLRDGTIEYLNDCSHSMKGQSVNLLNLQ